MAQSSGGTLPYRLLPAPKRWSAPRLGWTEWGFIAILAMALGMRLWELGGRTMHYDEAIHLHFSWRLANSDGALGGWPWIFGTDYLHSPWMHGPFQIELTAFVFKIFGDSDVTARLAYALFGTALVGLPYFLRDYLGRYGAFMAAVMLALSPSLLYFSRFGRNDIIMAFWAATLLILVWRYLHEGRRRYLYLAAAVLAFMFATKETAYLVTAVFGMSLFLLALPDMVPWALGRTKAVKNGAAGFFLLIFTLTLPQWSSAAGLVQNALGLTLTNPDPQTGQHVPSVDGTDGLIGAPAWAGRTLLLPVQDLPWPIHTLVVVAGIAVLVWLVSRGRPDVRRITCLAASPLLVTLAVGLAVFRPLSAAFDTTSVDQGLAGFLFVLAISVLVYHRYPWQRSLLLVLAPALAALLYSVLFTPVLDLQAVVDSILPGGVAVGASSNGLPINYLVALILLSGTLIVSAVLGIRWLGGQWLICAGIFYIIWSALYSTMFTNLAGLFSGSWQGMGYWIAQQDVARGNQPWYYYFVGLPVYELLPVVFGIIGAVYFLRKGDALGVFLVFWAAVTLLAYTLASEKMPWLLVNITLPFIFLSSKFLGELTERIRWREALRQGSVAVLVLAPLALVGAVYLLTTYLDAGDLDAAHWAMLGSTALVAIFAAYLMRTAGPGRAAPIASLGIAVLLLGFGAWGAVRAGYTYDDSNVELLVYAQGGADLGATAEILDRSVFPAQSSGESVLVDYDLWYPFQWYVRDQDSQGLLRFNCFKREGEDGWNEGCDALEPPEDNDEASPVRQNTPALLLTSTHADRDNAGLEGYEKNGPLVNLLWFPETYRRPGENRQSEGFKDEITQDFSFFKDVATSRESWRNALDYWLFRNLDQDWFKSEYYTYVR